MTAPSLDLHPPHLFLQALSSNVPSHAYYVTLFPHDTTTSLSLISLRILRLPLSVLVPGSWHIMGTQLMKSSHQQHFWEKEERFFHKFAFPREPPLRQVSRCCVDYKKTLVETLEQLAWKREQSLSPGRGLQVARA